MQKPTVTTHTDVRLTSSVRPEVKKVIRSRAAGLLSVVFWPMWYRSVGPQGKKTWFLLPQGVQKNLYP